MTGERISVHNKREKERSPYYDTRMFILSMDRALLYERIDKRIDIMLEQGLVSEVEQLYSKYDRSLVSMQGLGYKEIISYLEGECSLDEAVYVLKRDTRHFAKRQLTWFKHQCNGVWINVDEFDNSVDVAKHIAKQI
jgi:tRNA dimethylallyltransferase